MPAHNSKLARMYDVQGLTSAEDILEATNTNWDATMVQPMATVDGSTVRTDDGGFGLIIRPDNNQVLGMRSKRSYRMAKHREHIHALQPLIDAGIILPAHVAVWDNAALIAYQFRVPTLDVAVNGKDMVSPLLNLAFNYNGTKTDMAFFSDFRWFCKNQMGKIASITDIGDKVRHSGDVDAKFAEALKDKLAKLGTSLADHYDAMRKMVHKPLPWGSELFGYIGRSMGCTPEEIQVATVAPPNSLRGNAAIIPEVIECYAADDCGAPGTVWQAYNAVTRFETHGMRRQVKDAERKKVNAARNLLGLGAGVKDKHVSDAFKYAAELVAA